MDAELVNAIEILKKAGAVFCLPPDSGRSLTLKQVQERIQFGRTWILSNLHEFPNAWRAPGGGENGGGLRIPERDVVAFEKRRRVFSSS